MKLPKGFLEKLPLPSSELSDFLDSLDQESATSVRINRKKAILSAPAERVPWCENGYFLESRPRFTSDPAFHVGAYYPQEASSMFLSHILKSLELNTTPILALDLCAAPGGKTTLLQSELHSNSLIHANETIKSRNKILVENTLKWGVPNICTSENDPADFEGLHNFYDLILVDAPCSGEGLFRKQKGAVNQWSETAVEHCSARQRRILSDIWPSLKTGGILIYSTCTFNKQENEENLAWLEKQHDLEFLNIDISQFSEIVEVDEKFAKGYRFYPHRISGEGFFCSVIRKLGPATKKSKKLKNSLFTLTSKFENLATISVQDVLYTIQPEQLHNLSLLAQHFKNLKPGLEIGRSIGADSKVEHGMALLVGARIEQPIITLNLNDSLNYLCKQDIQLKVDKGRYALSFNGFILGYAKSDGRRLISQYPKNWRILNARSEEYSPIVSALK